MKHVLFIKRDVEFLFDFHVELKNIGLCAQLTQINNESCFKVGCETSSDCLKVGYLFAKFNVDAPYLLLNPTVQELNEWTN